MKNEQKEQEVKWLTGSAEYEGFPLVLRVRPDADSKEHRSVFQYIGIVTHKLAKVKPNGFPEADYNFTLLGFDLELIKFIESDGEGLVVIIETFTGKRTYYAYVFDENRFKAKAAEIKAIYPEHVLDVQTKSDPQWRLYSGYRKDFPW